MRRTRAHAPASGLTLVELVLALGLLAMLMAATFQLFERSLSLWRRGETRRAVLEQASVVGEDLASDLRGIEPGPRGDFVADWVRFDTDGDGVFESYWPRLRLVRQASAGEVLSLARDNAAANAAPAPKSDQPEQFSSSPALIEVLWMLEPAARVDPDARAEGRLWRGERLVGDPTTKSFFADDFFGTSNRPPAGAAEEVGGGILWLDFMFATQTSAVHEGWKKGSELTDAAASWDAWGRNRPDVDAYHWNEKHPGMPAARERPLLPRRVRIELEVERAGDRIRRTRLVEMLENQGNILRVEDGARVPTEPEAYVRIEGEWMKVVRVDGSEISVERGKRGSTAVPHPANALVHFGTRMVFEVPVATYRDDWDL
jgi:hypothetical protein